MNAVSSIKHVPRKRTLQRAELGWALFFLGPWIIGFLVFAAFPMLASLYLSMTDFKLDTDQPIQWVGLNNYRDITGIEIKSLERSDQKPESVLSNGYYDIGLRFGSTVVGVRDAAFWKSLQVTLVFAIVSLPVGMLVALSLALLTNLKMRGVGFYRTIFFLPYVIPTIATAVCFRLLFTRDTGWINSALVGVGLPRLSWLTDDNLILMAMVLISLWTVGNAMIIYLSGLQSIPTELYEAAKVDGADNWASFLHITVPMLTPVILYNLIIGLIGTFQYFTMAYAMTMQVGRNGAMVEGLNFYNVNLYRTAFVYSKMGYASAMAWILMLLVLVITGVVFFTSGKWVFYAGVTERK